MENVVPEIISFPGRKIHRWQTVVLGGDGGISFVDPNRLSFNNLPPPVHIEQFIVDRKTYQATLKKADLRLPPLIRDLQIDYTALSLVAPEKIRFRYKLESRDSDWQEAPTVDRSSITILLPAIIVFAS